jgi:hypothetical protein
MKKIYIAPETELELLESEEMIASSIDVFDETVSDEGDLLTREWFE